MAPHQLAFWRELLAPFPNDALSTTRRGGKELTYIDKRSLSNRLDSVCGPHGWYVEYEATARGYKCRLFISVPMGNPDTYVFMHKEDGAGFEEMGAKNRDTGEFEYDVDNDEKSAYTNAFRRAAQDAWGIGRYLYQKGIPSFLDPNARPDAPPPQSSFPQNAAQAAAANMAARPETPTARAAAEAAATPPSPAQPQSQNGKVYDNFKIPRAGSSVFAWVKEMEKTFETQLVGGMGSDGERITGTKIMKDWTQEQVNEIAGGVIGYIKTLPSYKGQFDHLATSAPAPAAQEATAQPTQAPAQGFDAAALPDLRKDLATQLQAFLHHQLGRPATPDELGRSLKTIAAEVPNGGGELGLAPEKLSTMTDSVWIRGMIAYVSDQIRIAASKPPVAENDIPF